jgi:hypothetical protein
MTSLLTQANVAVEQQPADARPVRSRLALLLLLPAALPVIPAGAVVAAGILKSTVGSTWLYDRLVTGFAPPSLPGLVLTLLVLFGPTLATLAMLTQLRKAARPTHQSG